MERTNIWLLVYRHKHGHDYNVFGNEEDAKIGACSIILEWMCDLEDIETEETLLLLITQKEWDKAIESYQEATAEWKFPEEFEIVKLPTIKLSPFTEKHLSDFQAAIDERKQEIDYVCPPSHENE